MFATHVLTFNFVQSDSGRERQLRNQACCQRKQYDLIVVAGNAVGADKAAFLALVYNSALPVVLNPQSDWLHGASTTGTTITNFHVHVLAVQAVATMVSIFRSA
jgi:hypothetical protein